MSPPGKQQVKYKSRWLLTRQGADNQSQTEKKRLQHTHALGRVLMSTMKERCHRSSVSPQCHFLVLKTQQGLCRNPGNFTQDKQTYSVANSPSIINSPVLSFPRRNHSSQQTETQPTARDLLLLRWERLQVNQDTHIPLTVGASGPIWLYDPVREGITEDRHHWTHDITSCLLEAEECQFITFSFSRF